MNREFYDTKIEKSILRCLAKKSVFFTELYQKGIPDEKIFADVSHRIIYKCISDYYLKYSKLPSSLAIKNYSKRINISDSLRSKMDVIIDRIYKVKITEREQDLFNIHYSELISLYELRMAQNHIKILADHIDSADIDKVKDEISKFQLSKYDESVEEFDFVDGFKERALKVIEFKNNYNNFSPIPTGIIEIDKRLDGGIFNEYCVIAGNSSTGKSSFLHHICKSASRVKKNGILFTIEMDKIEAATRIDSNISGIPLKKFKNPYLYDFTKNEIRMWKNKMKKIKKDWGKLQIISFLKGATVYDIAAKATQYVKKVGLDKLDYIAIDYLNDLKPVGKKYISNKEWTAQAEISWDLHLLNKGFVHPNGKKGIPVITAVAMSGSSRGITSAQNKNDNKRQMDERDIGMAKIIYQHSNVCLGIKEFNKDINQVVGMKARGGEKNWVVNIYPNFAYGRFHDPEKEKEVIELQDQEIEDSEDGILIDSDEIKE